MSPGLSSVRDCLFCKFVAREMSVDIISETDHTVALYDIEPQAEKHILILSKEHQSDIGSLLEADPDAAIAVLAEAKRLARAYGDGSYRLVFNTGEKSGQTIFHCHAHVLIGEVTAALPG